VKKLTQSANLRQICDTPMYAQWIADVAGNGYGQCAEITAQMAEAFPELRRGRGWYYCPYWGERAHWWLVAPNGDIVDPTAAQFPSGGRGAYVEYDGRPLPTGPCANCGGPVYDGDTVCSEKCYREFAASLQLRPPSDRSTQGS
jgi:hypothetical protein